TSTADVNIPDEDIKLSTQYQQVIFEYHFVNKAESPFSIILASAPYMDKLKDETANNTNNMVEHFYVSTYPLDEKDWADNVVEEELTPQVLSEEGSEVYIYISAKVKNENLKALYEGNFVWMLQKIESTKDITLDYGAELTLEDGTTATSQTLAVARPITNDDDEDIEFMMPCIKVPQREGYAFLGYYDANNTCYIDLSGKGLVVIDGNEATSLTSLTARWAEGLTIEKTTLVGVDDTKALENGVLTVPEGVTRVGNGETAVSTTATEVILPNSVVSISTGAFENNTTITTVKVGETTQTAAYSDELDNCKLKSIEENAFSGCTAITKFYVDKIETLLSIKYVANGHPFASTPENGEFYINNQLLTTITLPETIKEIPDFAFYCCRTLTNIEISTSVVKIGSFAFYGCNKLDNVVIPNGVEYIEKATFANCTSLVNIELSNYTIGIGDFVFQNCAIKNIDLPNTMNEMGNYVFSSCTALESIKIPDSITKIGIQSFINCTNLVTVVLPTQLQSIEENAFSNCGKLVNISLPSGLQSIGISAFYNCSSLLSITLPNQLISLGKNAFVGCQSLSEVNFEKNTILKELGVNVFLLSGIKNIIIPKSIENIGYQAFASSSLETISFEEGSELKNIEESAFIGCESLKEVNFPNKLTMARIIMAILVIIMLLFPYDQVGINIPVYEMGNVTIGL
ncbi:MAG: leucine-rich repeat domain-containing protein, partial [Clostridia bacterium]|nr:leucine-rich repeat domain-containing protein [Clostridia bacterium]